MHIIESGEVVKTLATLAPLTSLPRNDATNLGATFLTNIVQLSINIIPIANFALHLS